MYNLRAIHFVYFTLLTGQTEKFPLKVRKISHTIWFFYLNREIWLYSLRYIYIFNIIIITIFVIFVVIVIIINFLI